MLAIMFLPRQFQVSVVENVNERHLRKAIWLFPLYLLAINLFVLPIAFGGLLHFPAGSVDADTFVLTLPMVQKQEALALFVFIGGLSAATGMVIVETIALSTMVCNDLVMPVLLRCARCADRRSDLPGLLLGIRRGAIVLILLLGYVYFRLAGEAYALVSIGLVSFAAVAQFAPGDARRHLLEGRHARRRARRPGSASWSGATRCCCRRSPSRAGCRFVRRHGPFGIALLRPWRCSASPARSRSRMRCSGACSSTSAATSRCRCSAAQHPRARPGALFVDVFRAGGRRAAVARQRLGEGLVALLARFLGRSAPTRRFRLRARRGAMRRRALEADAELVHHVESLLAGAIGAASARVMVASVVKEEPLGIDEVLASSTRPRR